MVSMFTAYIIKWLYAWWLPSVCYQVITNVELGVSSTQSLQQTVFKALIALIGKAYKTQWTVYDYILLLKL